ncbi:hypothetical protein D3C84_868740 [compost metagenome]
MPWYARCLIRNFHHQRIPCWDEVTPLNLGNRSQDERMGKQRFIRFLLIDNKLRPPVFTFPILPHTVHIILVVTASHSNFNSLHCLLLQEAKLFPHDHISNDEKAIVQEKLRLFIRNHILQQRICFRYLDLLLAHWHNPLR